MCAERSLQGRLEASKERKRVKEWAERGLQGRLEASKQGEKDR